MRTVNDVIRDLRFLAQYEKKREYNEVNIGAVLNEAADMLSQFVKSSGEQTLFSAITVSPDRMAEFLADRVVLSPCMMICGNECTAVDGFGKTGREQCKQKLLEFLNQKVGGAE